MRFSLDIAPAYPPEAKLTRWRREVALDRGKREVVLTEDWALRESREPLRLDFVTPLRAGVSTPGRVWLSSPGGSAASVAGEHGHVLLYDAKIFVASVEEKVVDDGRLQPIWGDRLYRIVLTARERSLRGSHRIVVR